MKKALLILALAFAVNCGMAQSNDGGLFRRGETANETRGGLPGLPGHGEEGNQPAPIGSGAALLIGFGAAYAMCKKSKK